MRDNAPKELEIPSNLIYNATGLAGVYKEKVRLNENSEAFNDLVIIEIIKQEEQKGKIDSIFIPASVLHNQELLKGRVTSAGPLAIKDGISVGDEVLYDKFAAYYLPPDTIGTFIIVKAENVIVKYTS